MFRKCPQILNPGAEPSGHSWWLKWPHIMICGAPFCSVPVQHPAKQLMADRGSSSCPSSLSPVYTAASSFSFCGLQRRGWMLLFTCSTTWSLAEVPEQQAWSVHTNSKRQPLPPVTHSPNKQDKQKVREETEAQKKWRDSPAVTQQMIGRVRITLIDHWINPLAKHSARHYFWGGKPGRMISLGWEP